MSEFELHLLLHNIRSEKKNSMRQQRVDLTDCHDYGSATLPLIVNIIISICHSLKHETENAGCLILNHLSLAHYIAPKALQVIRTEKQLLIIFLDFDRNNLIKFFLLYSKLKNNERADQH